MSAAQLEIQLIASVVAIACALPGVFLVLRHMSLLSDAISHAILPGIVIAFFLVQDLGSPILIAGAVAMGMVTVSLTEAIHRTRLVREDAAIGMVFPVLFSIGVILVSRYAANVHLDTDSVLLGELAFAPFERFVVLGVDIGPRSLVIMSVILAANVLFVSVFFKELKLATFDPALAAAMGFAPVVLHYALMLMVSVTAVGAFDSVGSILVVALMIAPPAAAYLLTDSLPRMILLAAAVAAASAVSGFWVAHALDASIAGSMAGMSGVAFLAALLLSPRHGVIAAWGIRRRRTWEFATRMLIIHLLHHEGAREEEIECRTSHLLEHINWEERFADRVVRGSVDRGLIEESGGVLVLTAAGRTEARRAMEI